MNAKKIINVLPLAHRVQGEKFIAVFSLSYAHATLTKMKKSVHIKTLYILFITLEYLYGVGWRWGNKCFIIVLLL